MKNKNLTPEEYAVVEKIASKSKMDCWFYLGINDNGDDVIIECEDDKVIDLYDGISQLDSGITTLDDYDLTEEEKNCYINLMYKIKMSNILMPDRLITLLYNALVYLEEAYSCEKKLMETDIADEIGITEEEYTYIMNNCSKGEDK